MAAVQYTFTHKQYTEQHSKLIGKSAGLAPSCLTTEEKGRKNLSQGSRRVLVYILPKRTRYKTHTYTPTHYKTHTYACKVRHTSIRDTPIMHSQRRLTECFRALHSQGHARLGSRVSQLYRYSTWNLLEDHTFLWPISP